MRHSNHDLTPQDRADDLSAKFSGLVKTCRGSRSIAHAMRPRFWVAVCLNSICTNELLRPPHYSFSHEIKMTPMMTRHTAASGRIKSAEPLTSGEMRDTRSRLRAVKANT